jgi:putative lipoic acid-binding regulatory protein
MAHESDQLFNFPCRFPIKAMGRADGSLAAQVEALVRRHAPDVSAEDITTAASSRGNYVSVTVTITAHSREQLDAIYLDLNAHELILMTL